MNIIVYDDSLAFGGHQIMACRGMEALSEDPSLHVTACFNPGNLQLARRISSIPNLETVECMHAYRRFQGLRNHVSPHCIRRLKEIFRGVRSDVVLCVQGDIEQSSMAVLAARQAGIHCISYLAIPHRMSDMGARFGGLRDRFNRYLLNQPARYITISKGMKQKLMDRGVTKPITVVANGIPLPASIQPGPPIANPVIGLPGRIEFKQKAQDLMVEAFCRHRDAFRGCRLIIAGNGPDAGKLRRLAAAGPCSDLITFLPWQEDMEPFYGQIDFLVLPSRYEGVPLVMLEALARGIPVIGSACDGMKDLLPPSWTFHPGDADDLGRTFDGIRTTWEKDIDGVRKKVESEMNIDAFKAAFHRAVLQETKKKGAQGAR